ncbi:TerB family tellurite resistance protein [Microvirga sp. 17 mud 1-3]|uniref:tellurite resistance TerB family protein n=1 Tax=Microvirga sp. 17 mud 1-3 TaxID=2082949 RepID=UPI000D6C1B80|nr:TerB family tellurite resistance protein [Microvirga sp. 17 mud 1-3]AWM85606.1 Tellurite resistance protein TerB [Microvirga sp. 17 mud 1-3]
MSFLSHLRAFFGPAAVPEGSDGHGEQLTVAALLALVAQADGRLLRVEEEELRRALRARFGLEESEVERLVARARDGDAAPDPATTLIDRIVQDIPPTERPRLLALAYRIAAVDGNIHEFEDDLIWRTGRLLGLSETELADARRDALGDPEQVRSHG